MSRVTNIDWPTPIITSGQIEAFAQILIKKGIIDKSDIEANKNLLEESLKLSASPEGLPIVLYSYRPLEKTDLARPQPVSHDYASNSAAIQR